MKKLITLATAFALAFITGSALALNHTAWSTIVDEAATGSYDKSPDGGGIVYASNQAGAVAVVDFSADSLTDYNIINFTGDHTAQLSTDSNGKYKIKVLAGNNTTLFDVTSDVSATAGRHVFAMLLRRGVSGGNGHIVSILVNLDGDRLFTIGDGDKKFTTGPLRKVICGQSGSKNVISASCWTKDSLENAGNNDSDPTKLAEIQADAEELYPAPREIVVSGSSVSISEINKLVEDAKLANVTFDANATVNFDVPAAIKYNFVCSGALTFNGFPGQQEAAKFDFSRIAGGYKQAGARLIGINFRNNTNADRTLGDNDDAEVPGFTFPGKGWTQVTGGTVNNQALKIYDPATGTASDSTAKASWSSRDQYDTGASGDAKIIRGYLDESTSVQVKIPSVTGIPFDAYDVIIFTSTDSNNAKFSPKMVNGVLYSSDAKGNAKLASDWSDNWGLSKSTTIVMGRNAMRVNNLVGDLSIISGKNGNGGRGCVSAIMIIERKLRVGDEYVFANGDCTATNDGGVGGYTPKGLTISPISGITTDIGLAVKDVTLVLEGTSSAKADYVTLKNADGTSVNSGAPSVGGQWFKQDMTGLGAQIKWTFDTPQEIIVGTEAEMSASASSRIRLYKTTDNIRGCYLRLSGSMDQWRPVFAVSTVITSVPTKATKTISAPTDWSDIVWEGTESVDAKYIVTFESGALLNIDEDVECKGIVLNGAVAVSAEDGYTFPAINASGATSLAVNGGTIEFAAIPSSNITIAEGATLKFDVSSAKTINGIAGAGTFLKTGSAELTLNNKAGEYAIDGTTIQIEGGNIKLNCGVNGYGAHGNNADAKIKDATFVLGDNSKAIPITQYGWYDFYGTTTFENASDKTIFNGGKFRAYEGFKLIKRGAGKLTFATEYGAGDYIKDLAIEGGKIHFNNLNIIDSSALTLDFSKLASDATPFDGDFKLAANTAFKFPSALGEDTAFAICSGTLSGAVDGVREVTVGDTTGFANLTFDGNTVKYVWVVEKSEVTVGENITWAALTQLDGYKEGIPTTITLTGDVEIDFTEAVSVAQITFVGEHTATLVYTVVPSILEYKVEGGAAYEIKIPAVSDFPTTELIIPTGATYTICGPTEGDEKAWDGKITVNGTLKTEGKLNFSNSGNGVAANGTLEIVSGLTRMRFADRGMKGTLTIDAGATLQPHSYVDAVNYDGATVVNVYGTLDMSDTMARWTLRKTNVMNFYAGSTCIGDGQASGNNIGALQFNNSTECVLNFKKDGENEGTVEFSAKIHAQNAFTMDVEEGVIVNMSGSLGTGKEPFTLTGAGKINLTGIYEFNKPVTIDESATIVPAGGSFANGLKGTGSLMSAKDTADISWLTLPTSLKLIPGSFKVGFPSTATVYQQIAPIAAGATATEYTIYGSDDIQIALLCVYEDALYYGENGSDTYTFTPEQQSEIEAMSAGEVYEATTLSIAVTKYEGVPEGYLQWADGGHIYVAKKTDSISIKFTPASEREGLIAPTDAKVGGFPVAGKFWNHSKFCTETANVGVKEVFYLKDGNGEDAVANNAKTVCYYYAPNMYYTNAGSGISGRNKQTTGNGKLTYSYFDDPNKAINFPLEIGSLDDVTYSLQNSPSGKLGWEVAITNIPYQIFDLYIYQASDQTTDTIKLMPIAVRANNGDWKYFGGDGKGSTVPTDASAIWNGASYCDSETMVEGANYIRYRMSRASLGLEEGEQIESIYLSHPDKHDEARLGLAGIQIVKQENDGFFTRNPSATSTDWITENGWLSSSGEGTAWANRDEKNDAYVTIDCDQVQSININGEIAANEVKLINAVDSEGEFTFTANDGATLTASIDATSFHGKIQVCEGIKGAIALGPDAHIEVILGDDDVMDPRYLLPEGMTLTGGEVGFSGSGTIVCDGFIPTDYQKYLTADTWTGVLWVKNVNMSGGNLKTIADCKSANSTVRISGCYGWLSNGDPNASLELVDEGDVPALWLRDSSNGYVYNFQKLTGTGTFKFSTKADTGAAVTLADVSEFKGRFLSVDGEFDIGETHYTTTGRPFYLGGTGPATTEALISVADGATINPRGWTASSASFGASVTIDLETKPTLETPVKIIDGEFEAKDYLGTTVTLTVNGESVDGEYIITQNENGVFVAVSTIKRWTGNAQNMNWSDADNWNLGVPEEGDSVMINLAGNMTLNLPEDGVAALSTLVFTGSGALTLDATKLAQVGVISVGNGVTFTVACGSDVALALEGTGNLVKTGVGILTLKACDFANAEIREGTLDFFVDEGDTLTVASVISGDGVVKKTGAGELTLSGANTFAGGAEIAGGTLKAGVAGTATSAAVGTGTLKIDEGATFDINGQVFSADGLGYVIESAGTITNTGATIYGHARCVKSLTLTGNTTVAGSFWTIGLGNKAGKTTLVMDEHTLTIKMTGNDSNFSIEETEITGGGVIDIQTGCLRTNGGETFADGKIILNGGKIEVNTFEGVGTAMSVKDFEYKSGTFEGNNKLVVIGQVIDGRDTNKIQLADGATIYNANGFTLTIGANWGFDRVAYLDASDAVIDGLVFLYKQGGDAALVYWTNAGDAFDPSVIKVSQHLKSKLEDKGVKLELDAENKCLKLTRALGFMLMVK